MKLNSTFVLSSVLAFSAFSVAAQEANVSISPAPGEYETLPTEFVLTIDGPVSIKKNITGGNPLLITAPSGTSQQVTGTFSGNTVTCKIPSTSTLALDESGDYIVALRKDAITYTWEEGTPTKSELTEFTYTVKGSSQGGGDEDNTVKYDIDLIKTTPSLNPLDLDMKTLETLQLTFNMGGLKIDPAASDNAMVTIAGPSYRQTAQLMPNMDTGTVTVFKAFFNDPKYDGKYTLTIPEGILGDEQWIENHELGHANAAVSLEFTVEGGLDPSTITTDLSFNPIVTPGVGTKVNEIKEVKLLFDTTPYWKEDLEFTVYYQSNLQSTGMGSEFTKATVKKGEGNAVILEFGETAEKSGQYAINVAEGTFWNEEHSINPNGGSLNGEQKLYWMVVVPQATVEVTSHTPATDAKVESFVNGEAGIVFDTDDNELVDTLEVKVTGYELDSENASPVTILSATSKEKTDEGLICWKNDTGADIILYDNYNYEVSYTLLDADGGKLAEGIFEFNGASKVAVAFEVTSHTPATDAKVAAFVNGEAGIIFDSNDNARVEKLQVKVESTEGETILDAVSTEKTADGQICWKNDTGADIDLLEDTTYEVTYKLLDVEGNVLAEGSFKFDGATASGVSLIEADRTNVIFNIQGVQVKSANNLPAGLYIINGKKTVIR